jgi:hypothetical protein
MSGMIVASSDVNKNWANTVQNQLAREIISSANAPWTAMCVVEIQMTPGRIALPHSHDYITPAIYLTQASGQGVASFLGPRFDELVWIKPGEWGSIGPVDHLAIYPRLEPDMVTAHAFEVRNAPRVDLDTIPKPEKWRLVHDRVLQLGWGDKVSWPQNALEHLYRTDDGAVVGESSCFPTLPGTGQALGADFARRPYGEDLNA